MPTRAARRRRPERHRDGARNLPRIARPGRPAQMPQILYGDTRRSRCVCRAHSSARRVIALTICVVLVRPTPIAMPDSARVEAPSADVGMGVRGRGWVTPATGSQAAGHVMTCFALVGAVPIGSRGSGWAAPTSHTSRRFTMGSGRLLARADKSRTKALRRPDH
jgi:hypothetical protein